MSFVSITDAANYAGQMVEIETKGNGYQCNALKSVAGRIGLGERGLRRLLGGERKTINTRLAARIRLAYLDMCAAQIKRFQHAIKADQTKYGDSDDFRNAAADLADMGNKIEAAREKARAAYQGTQAKKEQAQ